MDRSNIEKIAQTGEDRLLLAKVWDKIIAGQRKNIPSHTCFLSPRELELTRYLFGDLEGLHNFGGHPGSERRMLVYLPDYLDESALMEDDSPVVCLRAEFYHGDSPSHRDFLGALMNLGIERCTLGDVIIRDNVGYVFATEEIAKFITGELSKVKRTDVRATEVDDVPSGELYKTEDKRIQIQSERLDAVIAKTYSLSRDDAQMLIKRSLVFVNGKETLSSSYTPKSGDKISVRGHGRLIYLGFDSTSRKGKLNATVSVYV